MLRDPITVLVDDTHAAHPGICADCLGRLLHGRRLYHSPAPLTRWKAGEVRAVLLDMAPARLVDPCDLPSHAAPALAALLDLLESTGRLHPGSAKPATLRRELDQAAPAVPAALADRSRWRLAKTLYTQMLAEGVDIDDDDACEAWAEAFSARDATARAAVVGPLAASDPGVLTARFIARNGQAAALDRTDPRNAGLTASAVFGGSASVEEEEPAAPYLPVPLPSREEAAEAARGSALLAGLVEISQLLLGRKATKDGEPVPADVEMLTIVTGEAEPGERLRHLEDAPSTAEMLRMAELLELVEPGFTGWLPGRRLRLLDAASTTGGAALAALSDDDALGLWRAAFTVAERMLAVPVGGDDTSWRDGLVAEVVITLYRNAGDGGDPLPVDPLARAAALTTAPPAPPAPPASADGQGLGDLATQLHELVVESRALLVLEQVATLQTLGALTLENDEEDDADAPPVPSLRSVPLHRSEHRAALTPLGLWAVHDQLQRDGLVEPRDQVSPPVLRS